MGLADIPNPKFVSADERVPGLKSDGRSWDMGILESFDLRRVPALTYVDSGNLKVAAAADTPARVMLNGFPNLLHPGQFLGSQIVSGAGFLCDGVFRQITVNATLPLTTGASLWGEEQNSQWYAVFATAAAGAAAFGLKAMPFLRFSTTGQPGVVITLRNNLNTANLSYGFSGDEFVGGQIYVLSGAYRGQLRPITANAAGTITYSGAALTMPQGDWFIVLPPSNFRWLGSVFNDAAGHLQEFAQIGDVFQWAAAPVSAHYVGNSYPDPTVKEDVPFMCPLADWAWLGINDGNVLALTFGDPLRSASFNKQVLRVVTGVSLGGDPLALTVGSAYTPGLQDISVAACRYALGLGICLSGEGAWVKCGGYAYRSGYLAL